MSEFCLQGRKKELFSAVKGLVLFSEVSSSQKYQSSRQELQVLNTSNQAIPFLVFMCVTKMTTLQAETFLGTSLWGGLVCRLVFWLNEMIVVLNNWISLPRICWHRVGWKASPGPWAGGVCVCTLLFWTLGATVFLRKVFWPMPLQTCRLGVAALTLWLNCPFPTLTPIFLLWQWTGRRDLPVWCQQLMALMQWCLCSDTSQTWRSYFTVLLGVVDTVKGTLNTGNCPAIWYITKLTHGLCVCLHHGIAFRWALWHTLFAARSTMVLARPRLGTACRKGWPLHRWMCCWANKTSREQKRKKQSLTQVQWNLQCVCELQGNQMLMEAPCAHLFSVNLLMGCLHIMSRNWSAGKWCDLSDVTEDACGKVRIWVRLSWSQVNCISFPLLSVHLAFPKHHPTSWDKYCTDTVTQFLFVAGWPF